MSEGPKTKLAELLIRAARSGASEADIVSTVSGTIGALFEDCFTRGFTRGGAHAAAAERARIVAWLRSGKACEHVEASEFAAAIENGEHER